MNEDPYTFGAAHGIVQTAMDVVDSRVLGEKYLQGIRISDNRQSISRIIIYVKFYFRY